VGASGARLHILHVLTHADVEVTRLLGDVKALAGPDVAVTVASVVGDPAHAIVRYARDHAVDLIVIGTHGRSGFSRALLGSVADRVLRAAACPVLVRAG
jgi:nucleotide-binding universal stress UspA family protein